MTTRQQQAVVVRLARQQSAARSQVRDNLLTQLRRLVARMAGRWYDRDALAQFHRDASALVRRGQVITGDATGSFIDRTVTQLGVHPLPGAVELPSLLRDVPADVEWERPAKVYRRLRLVGVDELEAQLKAEQRATQMASMDLALAAREAARQRMGPGVVGYRRIIHPELSKFGSCGLCVVAADQMYRREDLLPLHDDCECTVLPATVSADPGLSLNREDLDAVYAAAGGSTAREDLQRTRVTVLDHGELGPILANADYSYKTAAEAARDGDTGDPSAA